MQRTSHEDYRVRMQLAMKKQLRQILQDIPLEDCPSRIVEVGVGEGNFSLALKEFYPTLNITIVDRNLTSFRNNIRKRKKPSSIFKMLEEDIKHTSIPSRSVDWVFYHKLIHHLAAKDILLSLEEASRILREQGNLVIIDVNPQPQTKAQETLLKIYEIEMKIDLQTGRAYEKM